MTIRDECLERRGQLLRQNPRAKFVFQVRIDLWEQMHRELGYDFDADKPFEHFSKFCGADVEICSGVYWRYGLK